MAQVHEHQDSTESIDRSLDRETLGALLVRHPWAVRFLVLETALLSLAGVIPFVGASPMYYVAFGMLVSLAVLAALVAAVLALGEAIKRARRALRYRTV
ncbi:hypothetical protein [Halorubellus salinus]|uniref:hypothetical protein n=1 Tax=Halorubellus salinus TaxID=755309 RepID=UPI001D079F35|nr:hypothetical protein [Halorubellus salinus]